MDDVLVIRGICLLVKIEAYFVTRFRYFILFFVQQIQSLIIDILVMYTRPEFVPQEEEKSGEIEHS